MKLIKSILIPIVIGTLINNQSPSWATNAGEHYVVNCDAYSEVMAELANKFNYYYTSTKVYIKRDKPIELYRNTDNLQEKEDKLYLEFQFGYTNSLDLSVRNSVLYTQGLATKILKNCNNVEIVRFVFSNEYKTLNEIFEYKLKKNKIERDYYLNSSWCSCG